MSKRKRTPARVATEKRWKTQNKRVHIAFNYEKDRNTLEWLRSQCNGDESKFASFIKQLIIDKSVEGKCQS